MSVCPRCGAKVVADSKVWPVMPKKGDAAKEPQFFVGAFMCSACKTRFNAQVSAEGKGGRTVNVKNKVDRIIRIQGELMQTIKALKEKIAALEADKSSLMGEIEVLRKAAEARVVTLEAEVKQMREETQSLRELVSKAEPTVLMPSQNPNQPTSS